MSTNSRNRETNHSLLWSIHCHGHDAYLAGTIHISFKGYETLLNPMLAHLSEEARIYYGETDMSDLSGINRRTMDPNWPGLSHFLSPHTYRGFQKKIRHFTGLELDHIQHLPPMFISSYVASQLIESNQPSIDEVLWNKANELNLPSHGLESVAEQMEIYARIPLDYQLVQLKRMLGHLTKARASIKKLIKSYREQRIHFLYRQGKSTLGPIRQLMLKERNDEIVHRITTAMQDDDRIFFSVGAAHLAGKHGILHGLKRAGCTVKPVAI